MKGFTWVDWLVVLIVILGMLLIGHLSSRRTKNQEDYILGGRKLNSGLVGLSLFATLVSSLSYVSYPGEMIKYGPVFCAGLLSFPLAYWVIGRFLIPRFMSMHVKSAYEILEVKLGKGTRTLATLFFISLRFLWMSTIVFATIKVALQPIIGFQDSYVPLISLSIVLVTVVYTSIGGLKAVVWTDALQSLIMFLGAIITIVVIAFALGDSSVLSDQSLYRNWVKWDWLPRAHVRMTVANIFIMNCLWQICTAGSDQMAIQRYLSVGDVRKARKSYAISLTSSALIQVLLAVVGLFVMAYFTRFPGQMTPGTSISNDADSLFPLFIRIGLPAGITGIIAAALLAAAMSSLSGGLNSCATVIQEDILKKMKHFRHHSFTLRDIKVVSALLGLAVAGASMLVGYVTGNLFDVTVKVVNLVVAPLFVLFFMALFVPWASDTGTVIGGLCSLLAAVLIAFGPAGITPLWVMPVALVTGIACACLFSRFKCKRN